jgi:hypothetical protein
MIRSSLGSVPFVRKRQRKIEQQLSQLDHDPLERCNWRQFSEIGDAGAVITPHELITPAVTLSSSHGTFVLCVQTKRPRHNA